MPADATVSWLQLYRAAKNGDPTLVRRGLEQGLEYRVSSDLHVDVVGTAATWGHWNVVNAVLDFAKACKPPEKDSLSTRNALLLHNLPVVLKCGTKKLLRQFLDALNILYRQMTKPSVVESKKQIRNLLLNSIDKCSLPLFKVVESFVKLDQKWYKSALPTAFNNGRSGVFEHVMRSSKLTLSQAVKVTGIQEFYLAIAVGQGFEEDYFVGDRFFKNLQVENFVAAPENWHSPLTFFYDQACRVRGPDSAFAVAARFGKMKMLKILYEESRDYINEHDWCLVSRDMYREALRFGHRNVVNFLLKKSKNDWKLHISLEGHLEEQYSNIPANMYKILIDNYVEVLQKKYKAKTKMMRIGQCLSNEVEKKLKSGDDSSAIVILKDFDEFLGPQRMNLSFVNAVKYKSVEVVLFLKSRLRLLCPFNSLGHQAIGAALTPLCKRTQTLPNWLILETLLDTLPMGGSTCPCGELVPMDFYLHFDFYKISKDFDQYQFRNALENSESLLRILAARRLVPRALTLKRLFRQFFSRCETLSFVATRLICLADWLDLLDIYRLEILGSGKWFQVEYPDRDLFIFLFLRSLCGSANPFLRWNGFASYIAHPPERRRKLTALVHQLGLRIQLANRNYQESEELHQVRWTLSKNALLSLQSLSRLQIYRTAREKSTAAFRNGQYLPLSEVVQGICDEFFPHLREFMEFRG